MGEPKNYTRNTKLIDTHRYKIKNVPLNDVTSTRNLGVILDTALKFKPHTTHAIKKAKRALGFIIRNARNLKNVKTLLVLYYALVRSHLEFAILVWNPHHANTIKSIEQIQKRFLRYLHYREFEYYPVDVGYGELLSGFEIQSLENRRKVISLMFLYDILRGEITDPEVLEKIQLYIPRINSGIRMTFRLKNYRTDALKYSVVQRATGLYNNILVDRPDIDIFFHSRKEFKYIITEIYT